MDKKLKQRLIGAVVLVALLVIFVPMFFTKHNQTQSATTQIIPPAPEQPTIQQAPTPPEAPLSAQQSNAPSQDQSAIMTTQQPQPVENQPAESAPVMNQTQQPTSEAISTMQSLPQEVQQSVPVKGAVKTQPVKQPIKKIKSTVKKINTHQNSLNLHSDIITNPIKTLNIRKSHLTSANVVQAKKESVHTQKKRLEKAASYNKAYVVQLGAFSKSKNAERLIENLRVKGFTAFGYKVKQKNGLISTRVYVGPAVKLSSAKQMIEKLQNKMKIKGIVVQFDATKLR